MFSVVLELFLFLFAILTFLTGRCSLALHSLQSMLDASLVWASIGDAPKTPLPLGSPAPDGTSYAFLILGDIYAEAFPAQQMPIKTRIGDWAVSHLKAFWFNAFLGNGRLAPPLLSSEELALVFIVWLTAVNH